MAMSMEQIHRIKELQVQNKGPYQITKELGIHPKTVRKYMEQENFSSPGLGPKSDPLNWIPSASIDRVMGMVREMRDEVLREIDHMDLQQRQTLVLMLLKEVVIRGNGLVETVPAF